MYYKGNKSTIFITKDRELNNTPIVFLHGFLGSSKSWKNIRNKINYPSLAIDIPGHGKSSFNNLSSTYYFKDFSNELYLALSDLDIKKIHLCGYSLGARLALAFSSIYPKMVSTLLLESGTVGLNDKEEKEERLSKDLNKSTRIKENLNEFVKDWEKLDFFSKQKVRNNDDFLSQREIRLTHDKFQLSKSLEVFSLGNMPYMMNNYTKLSFPVIIINGKDDIKFIKEGRVMLNANKNSNQYIINNAGHNVHLENPELYIDTISPFFKEDITFT
ncbi:MAG: 2-succinyl-6-hydroxy-2,4-cyclohexadiene-1-carboxylate synthase [Candidatus Marinimicrobia bacterium]|nr:2-succinyl-6-hydroxy-2,4-cyclohexadiene-1-carboxylate synthase [Candidatus Neomarinimicrobiota bacterium]|tara:strand:- start:1554 stop:2372 length:819 start_codon:yes stop_codon:yes gene_type:complete